MLVSHRKRFIFTKTVKTAGTSIESYFEPYCMAEGMWQQSHARDEYVSEHGIIGYRGSGGKKVTWHNHMSASRIRQLVGNDVWDDYFKFTVVRNPFDKMISGFYMYERRKQGYDYYKRLKSIAKKVLDTGSPIDRIDGRTDVERFRSWVRKGGAILDRDKYMIDGEECVDYFIKFEDLHAGVQHVCDRLSIPFEADRLPAYKSSGREDRDHIRDYYDRETEMIVRALYAWELERFDYELSE